MRNLNFDFFDDHNLELADAISAQEVGALLVDQGWLPDETRDDVTIYRRPREENAAYEIDLPKKRNERYAPRILDGALMNSLYENRPIEEILAQWSRPQFDVARFRLISDKVENGTAPLYYVQSLVSGAFDALKAAVKDVETPCRYHARVDSSNIQELMKRAEFGQTQVGSYVINVLVPCGTQNERGSFEKTQERVYRKGVEHLIKTLDSVVRFAASESPNDFLTAQENENVSSNLLESVLDMRCDDDAELEISVDWSPLLPPSNNTPNCVHITKKHVDFMSEWAQTWRPKKMEEIRSFVGKVVEIRGRDRDVDSKPSGAVVFSIFDDEKNYEAEAELDVDDFRLAYEAYYDDAMITFRGKVVKGNGKTRIFEAENLHRVET